MSAATEHVTEAIHATDGEGNHVVHVKSLSVLLSHDDGDWFAQSLEIDYAAAGSTVEEVKENFAKGLSATILEHLRLHGEIDNLLKPAPQDAWTEFYAADPSSLKQKVSTIQFHCLKDGMPTGLLEEKMLQRFPFREIKFLEPLAA